MSEPTGDEIHRVCVYLAKLAEGMFRGSGVPGIENAGVYVSVCATDPEFCDAVAERGPWAVVDDVRKFDAMRNGCLSYQATNGQIVTPAQARALSGEPDQ